MTDSSGKICRVCGIFKSLDEFPVRKDSKDGYRNDCIICRNLASKQYFDANRDKCVSRQAKYNDEHRNLINSKARTRRIVLRDRIRDQEAKRYLKHREKRLQLALDYQRKHIDKVIIVQSKRRAWKMNSPGSITLEEWKSLCEYYGNRCLACHEEKPLTIDHVIPLSHGGTNTIDNIQPLCRSCNSRKHAKTIDYRF